jgi:hypothetical protein
MKDSQLKKLEGSTGQRPKCPKCGFTSDEWEFGVTIRQGDGIVDVGFRCLTCDTEFGFEYFKEEDFCAKNQN